MGRAGDGEGSEIRGRFGVEGEIGEQFAGEGAELEAMTGAGAGDDDIGMRRM